MGFSYRSGGFREYAVPLQVPNALMNRLSNFHYHHRVYVRVHGVMENRKTGLIYNIAVDGPALAYMHQKGLIYLDPKSTDKKNHYTYRLTEFGRLCLKEWEKDKKLPRVDKIRLPVKKFSKTTMLTDAAYKALKILQFYPETSAAGFADKMWPDNAAMKRGRKQALCGGSYAAKLEYKGWVRRYPVWPLKCWCGLTKVGEAAIEVYEKEFPDKIISLL